MRSVTERGQVSTSAADVYETFFVPALFAQWPRHVIEIGGIGAGDRVVDVARGTGVLARALLPVVGPTGSVAAVDVNEAMLAVAARTAPSVDWRHGAAEQLPLQSGSCDAVVSQFGLMFFDDAPVAVTEMVRVLRPGGRLAVAVWDALERCAGYAALADLLHRLFGDAAVNALRAPFKLGEATALRAVFASGGVRSPQLVTRAGTARFPSIDDWIYTDIKGWTLADMIDDDQYDRLLREARQVLQPFVQPDGGVAFPITAHIVRATAD